METRDRLLIGATIAASLIYWSVLFFWPECFQFIPGYVWHFMKFTDKPLAKFWLIFPLALISYLTISNVIKFPQNHKRNLVLLIVLGYLIQMGFGFMENRGIDGIRLRMVTTGHAEFARIAAVESDVKKIAKNYDRLLDEVENLKFARAKPPGHLIFYMLTEKAASLISSPDAPRDRFRFLATFASYLYPILTYLAIIPLFYFCRTFMDEKQAIIPCVLYLFIPSVTLVTLHLDQVLYPTLFMLGLYLVLYSCQTKNILLVFLSGAFIYIAVYISFSLMVVIPAGILCAAASLYNDDLSNLNLKRYIKMMAAFVGGLLIMAVIFKFYLNYDILDRYRDAIAFHQGWKDWESDISSTLLYGLLNYVEFACWLGLPITVFFLAGGHRAVTDTIKGRLDFINILAVSMLLILIVLGFFSKTKSEVGRLWIFLMPIVCVLAAHELSRRFESRLPSVLGLLLAFQLITILVIKRFQDFW